MARLNFWQLEGETKHNDLLQFAVNERTISNSLVLILLDFSQPWNLVNSLNRWLGIVENHIKSVTNLLTPEKVSELTNYRMYIRYYQIIIY